MGVGISVCLIDLNRLGDRLTGHNENWYKHEVFHGEGS